MQLYFSSKFLLFELPENRKVIEKTYIYIYKFHYFLSNEISNFGPWESIYIKFKKKSSNFYTLADIYFSTIFDDLAILQEALYSLLMHL